MEYGHRRESDGDFFLIDLNYRLRQRYCTSDYTPYIDAGFIASIQTGFSTINKVRGGEGRGQG